MWTLRKTFRFEASHQLPGHDGKCARLHGHSWVLHVSVSGERLLGGGPKADMLVDYGDLKAAVAPLIESHLDHYHLNDTTGLARPTSEALCRWIYERLPAWLRQMNLAVTIEETCTARCHYVPRQ